MSKTVKQMILHDYADRFGEESDVAVISIRGVGSNDTNALRATLRKKDKLAAKLTWLANRHELNLPEDRRHDRIVPRNPMSILKFDDGRAMACRIMDLSLSGAALAAEIKPLVGEPVMLGRVQARVVRHLEEGFAIEFVHAQLPETVKDNVSAQ